MEHAPTKLIELHRHSFSLSQPIQPSGPLLDVTNCSTAYVFVLSFLSVGNLYGFQVPKTAFLSHCYYGSTFEIFVGILLSSTFFFLSSYFNFNFFLYLPIKQIKDLYNKTNQRFIDRLKFLEFKFMTEIQINSIKIFEKI